jgi:AraC-like DNA-binding protein
VIASVIALQFNIAGDMDILKICTLFSLALFCLFFTIYLLAKNRKEGHNNLWLLVGFGALSFANFIEVCFYFVDFRNIIAPYVFHVFYEKQVLELLMLPSFYLYLKKYYGQQVKGVKHVGVYVVMIAGILVYTLLSKNNEDVTSASCYRDLWSYPANTVIGFAESGQMLLYGLLTHGLLKNKRHLFKHWHSSLFFALIIIKSLGLIDHFISINVPYQDFQIYLAIFNKAGFLLCLFVLFLLEIKYSFATSNEQSVREKYYTSRLTEGQKNAIIYRMETYFQQKPYLNAEFNMDQLANEIGFPKTYISQAINQLFKLNFREYINRLRIEESIELIKTGNGNLIIKEIYYEVGFNSKSVFNSAFKKYTGVTPTEYRSTVSNHFQPPTYRLQHSHQK